MKFIFIDEIQMLNKEKYNKLDETVKKNEIELMSRGYSML